MKSRASRDLAALVLALLSGVARAADDRPGTKVESASHLELVLVPGGTFHAGCEPGDTECSEDEKPGRTTTVAPLWVSRTEVTVEAYARCVAKGSCTAPRTDNACTWGVAGLEHHPINCVTWDQARAFCAWMGGRLPTADEWEYAAKGGESRIYPWGNDRLDGHRANFAEHQYTRKYPLGAAGQTDDDGWMETAPVGSYPEGASKHGLLDMAGNVAEWTSTDFAPDQKEVRGGGWATERRSYRLRASYRTGFARADWHVTIGMRCVVPAGKKRRRSHGE